MVAEALLIPSSRRRRNASSSVNQTRDTESVGVNGLIAKGVPLVCFSSKIAFSRNLLTVPSVWLLARLGERHRNYSYTFLSS